MLKIIPIFAPGSSTQFEGAVDSAIGYFEHHIQNNLTISMEFSDAPLSAGSAANNTDTFDATGFTYQQVSSALRSHTTNLDQVISDLSLPSSSPFGSHLFTITNAEAAALNLPTNYSSAGETVNGQPIDGLVTLNSNLSFNFTQHNIQPTQYDAVGTLEHEISEALGRVEFQTDPLGFFPSIEGLHIFTAPFKVDSTPLTPSQNQPYFSIDGGITNLGQIGQQFNAPGEDIADWTSMSLIDSFGFAHTGHINPISAVDQVQMTTLGWAWSGLPV